MIILINRCAYSRSKYSIEIYKTITDVDVYLLNNTILNLIM